MRSDIRSSVLEAIRRAEQDYAKKKAAYDTNPSDRDAEQAMIDARAYLDNMWNRGNCAEIETA